MGCVVAFREALRTGCGESLPDWRTEHRKCRPLRIAHGDAGRQRLRAQPEQLVVRAGLSAIGDRAGSAAAEAIKLQLRQALFAQLVARSSTAPAPASL